VALRDYLRIAVRRVSHLARAAFGFYDPAYVPGGVLGLVPPKRSGLLVIKGWFRHGLFSFQRDPWQLVEVWCDGRFVGSLTQGIGNRTRVVAPLRAGSHTVEVFGVTLRLREKTLLHRREFEVKPGEVVYLSFVPPRANPVIRTPTRDARWHFASWTVDLH
jgi:hypothetical protein